MKQIIEHIEQLITKHDCVIVPGLGGFITHREPAKLVNNKFFPPQTVISFNALLTHSDGLLAEAIMQSEQIDYRAALAEIDRQIGHICQIVTDGTPFQMGKLGTLYRSEAGTMAFTPTSADFLPENLGLKPIGLRPLSQPVVPQHNLTIPLPDTTSNLWKYAAAIIVLCIFTLLAPQPTHTNYYKAAFKLPSYKVTQLFEEPAAPQPLIDSLSVQPQTDSVVTTPVAEAPAPVKPLRYHIIVASLPTYNDAVEYCRTQSTAANPLHIISRDGKHRVAWRSFATNTEAFSCLDSIRHKGAGNQKVWILKATI